MKKNNLIITSAAAMVALVAITGVSIMTYASSNTDDTTTNTTTTERRGKGDMGKNWNNLTNEEKATMEAERQARQAEMEAHKEEVDKAIETGDYATWVKVAGEDCPMLEKINEGNFARFVEMHNLRKQADVIAQELGIEKGANRGMGKIGGNKGMGCMNK